MHVTRGDGQMGKMEEGGASERARERESEGEKEGGREGEGGRANARKEGPGPVALGRDVWRALAWEQNVLDHRETAGEAGARRRELPPAHARPGA